MPLSVARVVNIFQLRAVTEVQWIYTPPVVTLVANHIVGVGDERISCPVHELIGVDLLAIDIYPF